MCALIWTLSIVSTIMGNLTKASRRSSAILLLLVSMLRSGNAIAQNTEDDSNWVTIDLRGEQCVLRDFEDRPDGWLHGLRVWFGRELQLNCSFYAAEPSWREHKCSLLAGGMIIGTPSPLYYTYSVAFFDTDENLIACSGGELDTPQAVTDELTSVTRAMSIPKGVYKDVRSYRVAYIESGKPVGEVIWNENEPVTVSNVDGDTGQVDEQSWPAWKSDGQLLDKTIKIRKGSRRILSSDENGWSAITVEGPITFSARAKGKSKRGGEIHQKTEMLSNDTDSKHLITIDKGTALQAELQVHLSAANRIQTAVRFNNTSTKEIHGVLYFAFFDKFGNFVGGADQDASIVSNSTIPLIAVDGKEPPTLSVFQRIKDISLPKGLEQTVVAYKVTLYESPSPIGISGQLKAANVAE